LIDASPLIYLAQVEGLLWLEKLFGQVHMTAQVHHEVLMALPL
jgi:predicted nucleic acid-binding protein